MGIQKKSFLGDFTYTFFSQILVAILNILVLKLLAQQIDENSFGAYLVIRRVLTIGFPLITLNLAVSMARFISFEPQKAQTYFIYSLTLYSALWLIFLPGILFFDKWIANVLFGSELYAILLMPVYMFFYSNCFQGICAGFFRGKHEFNKMNLVNIVFWSIALFSLILLNYTGENYLNFLRLYFLLFAAIAFLLNNYLIFRNNDILSHLKKLVPLILSFKFIYNETPFIRYGTSRIPSTIYFSLIFFVPVLAASNSISLIAAAYVGIVITVLRMSELLGFPFYMLFVPKFSAIQAENNTQLIQKYCQIVLDSLFTIPLILGVLLSFFAPEVILLWFGDKYNIVIPSLILISPTSSAFIGYILNRGILDGFSNYPYTNHITMWSMIVVIVGSTITIVFSINFIGLVISFGLGMITLGAGSIYFMGKEQHIKILSYKNLISLTWFSLILICNYYYHYYLEVEITLTNSLIKIASALIIVIASFILYKKLRYQWVDEFYQRIDYLRKNYQ